jgi:hypothetical protein
MSITTTIDEVFTGRRPPSLVEDDGHLDLLRVLAHRDDEERTLLIEVGSIDAGDTAEELFTGQLLSVANGIFLSPAQALGLAVYLVAVALPEDRVERADAMVTFSERVVARIVASS